MSVIPLGTPMRSDALHVAPVRAEAVQVELDPAAADEQHDDLQHAAASMYAIIVPIAMPVNPMLRQAPHAPASGPR